MKGVLPRVELAISGKAFVRDRLVSCTVGIEKGRIRKIAKTVSAERRIETRGVILPGAIDAHVHMRDPGLSYKEDFRTGTIAAAHGGVTTVLDMPNTQPPVASRAAFEEKLAIAKRKSCIDFGLYGTPAPDGALALGARPVAYKLYLAETTGTRGIDLKKVPRILALAQKLRVPVSIHAEDPALLEANAHVAEEGPRLHARRRPEECEVEAIRKLLPYSRSGNLHVAHVSTGEGALLLSKTRATFEVTPHHLLLTEKELAQSSELICNPPLRSEASRSALFSAFSRGIAILASDHAPHTREEKHGPDAAIPAGLPGVETCVPVLLQLAARKQLDLAVLVRAFSELPARRFGLFRKGRIAVGMDADLAIYDLDAPRKILRENLHSRSGWSPFEHRYGVFPTDVFVRGQTVLRDGEFVGAAGTGKEVEISRPG